MALRTKLLLSLTSLALIPLILFGLVAYQVSTTNLINVERQNLQDALESTNRALEDIKTNMSKPVRDYSNWDDLHDRINQASPDLDWVKTNFDPSSPSSVATTFSLDAIGLWNKDHKLIYGLGQPEELAKMAAPLTKDVMTVTEPQTTLLLTGSDVYIVGVDAIFTSTITDPNGMLLFARKLGAGDINQIKALTGYDISLYQGTTQIASTLDPKQGSAVTPSADDLNKAATGQVAFDQRDPGIALAYDPIKDSNGTTVATMVISRPRIATVTAQSSITGTLAVSFIFAGALALLVAFLLQRSITQPLLAMADSADKLTAGDLTQRVSAPSRDELGRLATAFNQMAERLGERISGTESENEQLRSLEEYRLNLIAAIINELNTPITTIKKHSESLSMALYGSLNEAQQRLISGISRAVAMQAALISDLNDFSGAQQKRLRMALERLPLASVTADAVKAVQDRHHDKAIQFASLLPPDLPPVFADRTRMTQIMEILLDWAFDYSVPNGRVTLSAATRPGAIQVSLSDTSRGLSEQERAKIFDLFYHVNGKARNGNESHERAGLGLALVKALIEQQGGTISLMTQPDKGNTFTFVMPTTN